MAARGIESEKVTAEGGAGGELQVYILARNVAGSLAVTCLHSRYCPLPPLLLVPLGSFPSPTSIHPTDSPSLAGMGERPF